MLNSIDENEQAAMDGEEEVEADEETADALRHLEELQEEYLQISDDIDEAALSLHSSGFPLLFFVFSSPSLLQFATQRRKCHGRGIVSYGRSPSLARKALRRAIRTIELANN